MSNLALLDFNDLPRFDEITPEQVMPCISQLVHDAKEALAQVSQEDFPPVWDSMAQVLDVRTEKLSRAWGAVNHLNSVADNPALRVAYNEALPLVTEFWTQLGSSSELYKKYKSIDKSALNPVQAQALKKALKGFVLSGAELQGEDKAKFANIQTRLSELSQKFSENVLDATDAWSYLASTEELAGAPSDLLKGTEQHALKEDPNAAPGTHKLTLKMPCYLPLMQYAHSRELRERLYRAYVTRASDQSQADHLQFDNTKIIEQILALRRQEAKLLGFENFAQLSLATKMAKSPDEVIEFLRSLAKRAKPYALKDAQELREFADQELDLKEPTFWDWTYVSERLKEAKYSFSEQELKAYFPAPVVLKGLFKIVEKLFEVEIKSDRAATWNEHVEFYKIERDGTLLGQFYLDPGARTGKRGGAWMDDVRARWFRPDEKKLQTPVAHLVCNFSQGTGNEPPLLTHDEVITLFHEFGHGLHHMLTQINERDVAGISGVEWDAVELPSQFMENFCWEWGILQELSAHIKTGEKLPRSLFDKMIAAKNFQSGLQTLRQVEFALFDMLLHTNPDPSKSFMNILHEVRVETAVLPSPDWGRTPHSFSHIFAGGYAAGYYSYKWAEVLSADAYSAFEESVLPSGEPDVQTGRRYRMNILEVGGSRPALESFIAFRGREPSIDALMRHQGMMERAEA